jgi:hypothetical protein
MRLDSLFGGSAIAAALFFGAATLASSAALAAEQPFKATIEAQAVGFPVGVYESSGIAAGLGKITESGHYRFVQYVQPGVAYLEGSGFAGATGGGTFATSGVFRSAVELGLSIEYSGTIKY